MIVEEHGVAGASPWGCTATLGNFAKATFDAISKTYSYLTRPQMNQSRVWVELEQSVGMDTQQNRKYHTTSKKIKIAALRMYTSCVEKTDFEEFFQRCQMPDTFNSWFLITLLHVWMCLVRMKQEGRSGKYMCRIIVHFMWEDVEQRGRVMGVNSYILKKNMAYMTNSFYASILGYDEGILSDDRGLAAALWRTFFNQKCEDPRQLELLVEYVRKQILRGQEIHSVCMNGFTHPEAGHGGFSGVSQWFTLHDWPQNPGWVNHLTTGDHSSCRQLTSMSCCESHLCFMDLAPGAEGASCHEFTSMALLASNKQEREGQITALEQTGLIGPASCLM
ncbi:Ubiquinol-cytochrome c reductase complex chaperone CBP3-like [Cricetulus griseus]|uniref:Ubiquinol-cytochrome c reductase complex chaperone CBP3-like n=1 Tax=Cricetulus griseus TaxID=10029 RepID=G3HAQ4_CRIGR|nr:Ubiquinol-cytochrome c reductase complex chaperone CBP3-like [Cricetulus griseus]